MNKFLKKLLILIILIAVAVIAFKVAMIPKEVELGEGFKTKEIEYTLERFEFTEKIGTSFDGFCLPVDRDYSYKQADNGRVYVSISYTVENITKESIGLAAEIGTLEDADGYTYQTDVYSDDAANYFFDPSDNTWKSFQTLASIEPKTGKIQCVAYFEVPASLASEGHPLKFYPVMPLGHRCAYIIE